MSCPQLILDTLLLDELKEGCAFEVQIDSVITDHLFNQKQNDDDLIY